MVLQIKYEIFLFFNNVPLTHFPANPIQGCKYIVKQAEQIKKESISGLM